jgi:hypothetical protein
MMHEKYFNDCAFTLAYLNQNRTGADVIHFLKQIALDARREALVEARGAVDIVALEHGWQDYDRAKVVAAILALEGK